MASPFPLFDFEWDPAKARSNVAKHGVSFEQAVQVFRDPLALTTFDEDHSESEERWVTMGRAEGDELLVIVHTFRDEHRDQVAIRLISARRATNRERHQYETAP